MNTIKNSFSKIKASDEFKGKLLKELQATSLKQKYSGNDNINKTKILNTSNYKEEYLNHRKIHYKKYIATAAVFCVLIGMFSSKLALNEIPKENDNSEIIAYDPQTEPVTENDRLTINSNEENDKKSQAAASTYSNIDKATKSTVGNLEKVENSKSYAKGETIINTTEENKTTNNRDNIISNKPVAYSDKTTIKNDSTLKANESPKQDIIQDYKDSGSNLTTKANKPEALEDTTALTKSIQENVNSVETASVNSIYIPKYELSQSATYAARRMMPLIIYKGNIYLHSTVAIDSKDVNKLLGQKLGTTKNTIDEWNSEKNYSIELASNIGITDVYTVNGYDEEFRIMTNYKSENGTNTADLYECLNGITISSGNDILSKLNLKDNVARAKFQSYSDWNNGTNIYHPIDNINLLYDLFNEIEKGKPYVAENIEDTLEDYKNDSEYKELSLDLKDGTKNVTLTIFKNGYASYGYPKIYFKIDSNFTKELWDKLNA